MAKSHTRDVEHELVGPVGSVPILIPKSASARQAPILPYGAATLADRDHAALPFVWAEDVLLHEPRAEIWVGVRTPGTELPDRARLIRDGAPRGRRIRDAGGRARGRAPGAVHDPGLLSHLRTVHAEWMASGIPEMAGQDRVVPYVFPTGACSRASRCASRPRSTAGPDAGATTR